MSIRKNYAAAPGFAVTDEDREECWHVHPHPWIAAEHVNNLIGGITSIRERMHILFSGYDAFARLHVVARDRNVPVSKVVEEVRGAGTSVGVLFETAPTSVRAFL